MTTKQVQAVPSSALSPQAILLPLVLAQFVCSFAGSSLNVAISGIAASLGTTVSGVQTAITLFTLTMAVLMIPGSKLTDLYGRKRCFTIGLIVYGIGALIAAASQSLTGLIVGYSLLQGIGTALLIPPVYIMATVFFAGLARARAFGSISAGGGVGAAAGPLIGGLITTTTSWRFTFVAQALLMAAIVIMSRRIAESGAEGTRPLLTSSVPFFRQPGCSLWSSVSCRPEHTAGSRRRQDFTIGNTVVIPQGGISPVWLFVAIGAVFLLLFFLHIRSVERAGGDPLLSMRMFQHRASNLGLITQNIQWLVLMGTSFVVSVYLQEVRHYNPIQTGLILTPNTIGILLSSMSAGRLAQRYSQRTLVRTGFALTVGGIILLLLLVNATSSVLTFAPGLLLIGLGVGLMLTSSVNIVQSSFPEQDQGEISGLSRSVSNLGSSMGVAIAGTLLVADIVSGNEGYALAVAALAIFGLVGLLVAWLLPPGVAPVSVPGEGVANS